MLFPDRKTMATHAELAVEALQKTQANNVNITTLVLSSYLEKWTDARWRSSIKRAHARVCR